MSSTLRATLAVLTLLLLSSYRLLAQAGGNTSAKINADLPAITSDKKLAVTIYIDPAGLPDTVGLSYAFYRYNPKGDSTLLCRKAAPSFVLKRMIRSYNVELAAKGVDTAWYLSAFYNVLYKTGAVPPGRYKAFIALRKGDSIAGGHAISYEVDSGLSLSSPVRKELNGTLVPGQPSGFAARLFAPQVNTLSTAATTATKAIERGRHRLDKALKLRGLSSQVQQVGGKAYINLYYEDWFVGRYETEAGQSMAGQIDQQKAQLSGGITSTANTELQGYRSLLSQVKDLAKQKKEDKELRGQIGVSSSFSSGQPEYSTQDNNYYELRGEVETEVMDIPVGIEGYYTSQDAHRSIKSSYVRVHYDAEKAKAELLKLIGGFKQQYSNTVAKGKGLEQVYGSYLTNLKDSKGALLADLKKETGLTSVDGGGGPGGINGDALKAQIRAGLEAKMAAAVKDTAALISAAEQKLDSAGRTKALASKATATAAKAKQLEDSVEHLYQKALKRYEQAQALEKKIEKYEATCRLR